MSRWSDKEYRLWEIWAKAIEPPSELSLADWSEQNLRLPEGQDRGGPLHHWPYMTEIINAIGDKRLERVTLMKSVRLGFTKALMFATCAAAATDPSPIIILVPTDDDARRTAVEEVEPMFEASPVMAGLIKKGRNDGRNTLHRKSLLGGGSIKILSARAPRKLRAHDAKYLFIDEADGMEITTEGDPISIAIGRTFARSGRKIVIGSTPTEENISVVERNYAESDQRVFEVPCPHCGVFNEIMWENIRWPQDDTGYQPDKAHYLCPHCETAVEERQKPEMVKQGRWRITRPDIEGHAGFRINSLVSLLANAKWSWLASEWLKAKRAGPSELQPFTNLYLAKPWRVTIKRVDADTLRDRTEAFGVHKIPAEVVLITVGADVQDERIEATVLGWTKDGMAPYVLAHVQFDGNTLEDEVWSEFDKWTKSKWKHPNGWMIPIDGVAVNSGGREGRTQKIYDWTAPRLARRIHAIKGREGPIAIWKRAEKVKGDMRLVIIGVDVVKTKVMDGLANPHLNDDGTINPAGMRFSDDLPDDWFDQVTNEVRRIKYERGRPKIVFEPKREGARTEALDCCVYGTAIRYSPAVRSIDLEARAALKIEASAEEAPKKAKSVADFAAAFNG